MTVYVCQFIAIPDEITLEEALECVAHRRMPLTINPDDRGRLDMFDSDEHGNPIRIALPRSREVGDIYESEYDTPNFIGYKPLKRDVSTDKKLGDVSREEGHKENVA